MLLARRTATDQWLPIIIGCIIMEKEFECFKIKDGLYLASRSVAYVPPL
jgi:hypothetical protein